MQTRSGVLAINRFHSIKTSSFCSAHRQICKLHLRYHLFLAFGVFSQVKIYYCRTYVGIHESFGILFIFRFTPVQASLSVIHLIKITYSRFVTVCDV